MSAESYFTIRCIVAALLASLLSLHGYKKKSLDVTGSVRRLLNNLILIARIVDSPTSIL